MKKKQYWQKLPKSTKRKNLAKLGIIGTGLIGGSIGLASRDAGYQVFCLNRKEETSQNAVKKGVADSYCNSTAELLKTSDIIIIASYLGGYKDILNNIKNDVEEHHIITDVGSVKEKIYHLAQDILGKKISNFVPAHPVAGKELTGLENADKTLFQNKKVIITETKGIAQDKGKQNIIIELWESLGSNVEILDSKLHDLIYTRISHFPQFLSFKLSSFFPASEIEQLSDFSRLMNSSEAMWHEIFAYNADNINTCLKDFVERYYIEIKNYKFTNSGEVNYQQVAHIISDIYLKILDEKYEKYSGTGFKSFTSAYIKNKQMLFNVISQSTKVKIEQIIKELENCNLSGNV